MGRPREKTQPGRPRHGWEDDIKMDVQQVEWGGVNWIYLIHNRDKWRAVVNAVTNFGFRKVRRIS